MSYQLYYTLNCNIVEKDLTSKQKKLITSKINSITPEQKKAIFLLICEHYKNIHGNVDQIPYEGVQEKIGVTFDLDKFPPQLKHIIYKFINVVCLKNDK